MAKNKKTKKETKESKSQSDYSSKTLGGIVIDRVSDIRQGIQELHKRRRSVAFSTLGDLINDWLQGKIRFVETKKVSVSGDPAKILERLGDKGLSIDDFKDLKTRPLEDALVSFHDIIADLTYLLIKGVIAPETVGYLAPDYKGIGAIIDIDEIRRRFPEECKCTNVCVGDDTGEEVWGIVAVDVVVLIVDAVRFSE